MKLRVFNSIFCVMLAILPLTSCDKNDKDEPQPHWVVSIPRISVISFRYQKSLLRHMETMRCLMSFMMILIIPRPESSEL